MKASVLATLLLAGHNRSSPLRQPSLLDNLYEMAKQDDKIAKMLDNLTHATDERTIKLVKYLSKMDGSHTFGSYQAWLELHDKTNSENDHDIDNMSSLLSSHSATSPLPADDEDGEHSTSTPKKKTYWQRQHKGEWWKKKTGYDWGKENPDALAALRKEHNWWHAAKVWWKFNKIWQQDHQVEENPEVFEAMGAIVGVEQEDVDTYDSMDYLYEYDALFDEYGDDFSQLNSIFLDEALELTEEETQALGLDGW